MRVAEKHAQTVPKGDVMFDDSLDVLRVTP